MLLCPLLSHIRRDSSAKQVLLTGASLVDVLTLLLPFTKGSLVPHCRGPSASLR